MLRSALLQTLREKLYFMRKNPIFALFRWITRFISGLVFSIGLLVVGICIFMFFKFSNVSMTPLDSRPKEKFYLKLTLDGELVNKSPEQSNFSSLITKMLKDKEQELYVPHLRKILTQAQDDPQVLGLLIELKSLDGPLTEFDEFRKVLAEFSSKGKNLAIWSPQFENKTYYLASIANQIHLAPEGQVSLPGPMFQLIYVGNALSKLGIDFNVIKAGQFKSAFEPLVSDDPSPETQTAYSAIEKSIRLYMTTEIAKGRNINDPQVEKWLHRSMFNAKEALSEKMVDYLNYYESFEDSFKKDAKIYDFAKYSPTNAKDKLPKFLNQGQGIALIEAIGEMHLGHTNTGFDADSLHDELKWAREDKDVMAVVLRIDSPGGSALAADLVWEDVRLLNKTKPVIVSMGAYAASGGYYMAAPATKIIASPLTITGSIGVIGLIPNLEQFREKYGVSFHIISESDRRNLLNPGTQMTEEDKTLLQQHIDATYHTFVARVASGRKMAFNDAEAIAQGRVWTGEQAKALGLVDELGSLADAFKMAKQHANLNTELLYPVLRYEGSDLSLRNCLKTRKFLSCFTNSSDLGLPPAASGLLNTLRNLVQDQKVKVLTLLPQFIQL